MLGKTYDTQVCSIARTLEFVGERWTLLILRNALFAGSTRYSEFLRSLGIATNVLQDRLDGLVAAGIFVRHAPSEAAGTIEYLLTDKGRDLQPALIALTEWGDKWAAPDGPPILYRHAVCASPVSNELVCEACGRIDDGAEVLALAGPGMPPDRAERVNRRFAARTSGLEAH